MEERTEPKVVYRFIPCPQYDVSGTECWLSEMAAQGLLLQEDGFFCGIATFEKRTPASVRYCLAASGKAPGILDEKAGSLSEEELELHKEFGWEYVAKRGEFHIFRTTDMNARELHTDREIQAFAMNAMKKRQWDSIFTSIFSLIFYPWLWMRGKILMTMIHFGTGPILLMALAVLWTSIHSIMNAIKLIRLRNQVLCGGSFGSGENWKRGVKSYHVNNILRRFVCTVAIVLLLKIWAEGVSYEHYIPLEEYTGNPPFYTMEDFVPEGKMKLRLMKIGNLNTIRQWSDILAPVNYEWDEAGTVTGSDGTILSGGLEVIYHETKADWIATRLFKEYLRKGKGEKEYEPLELKIEELDDVTAYTSTLHFPSVILQKDHKVLYARFYTSGDETIKPELEEWAGYLAECLLK